MASGSTEVIIDVQATLIPRCAELFVAVFSGPPWHEPWTTESASQRLAEITGTPGFAGVALAAGNTLTGAALGHTERWHAGSVFYLREMFIRPALQRQGRGSRLLAALDKRVPNATGYYLITDRGTPAQAFYEKHGYAQAPGRIMLTRQSGH
jgi:GNAT superfamily N-acetyltransferase